MKLPKKLDYCYQCKLRQRCIEDYQRKYASLCVYFKDGLCQKYNFSCDIDIMRINMMDNALIELAEKESRKGLKK